MDYRLQFTGLFDIVSHYQHAYEDDEWHYFTDSVKILSWTTTGILVPVEQGSGSGCPSVDTTGLLGFHGYCNPNHYVHGQFFGVDSFAMTLEMNQIPHTFSYTVTGRRH